MNVKYIDEDKQLIFEITEEIDHHTTENLRRKFDYEIERHSPKTTIFDFNKVAFMDSAGIGMLIGRYKRAKMFGGNVEIINANPSVKKIFEMCGLGKIIKIS